jgi:adenosylmethionine-8-amino-7-oxononanoate aminotransferase
VAEGMTDRLRRQALRREIVALDKRRVWHPYTAMARYADADPIVVERAEGSRLYDVDGRSYIDGNASWWTALLGHGHPRLVAALRGQSERLCHAPLAGIAHEPAARLAEELCAVAPAGLGRVFFSDDGSTAVEVALKLALQYWRNQGADRRRFVALDGAFHGETLGVTALGGVEIFRRPFAGVLLECVHVPPPVRGGDAAQYDRAFEAMAALLRREGHEVAAVVVEPVLQGAAGMRDYDPAYLRELRSLCDETGVLLVADEVFTGYGRTGPMWGCDHAGIAPDVLCTAKGFSGGVLPMAATLATERIFAAFLGDDARTFHYGHTYCGNPLGAAVAREVLAIYRDERILERARPKAGRVAEAFETRIARLPGVVATRSCGLTGAADLASGSGSGSGSGYLGRRGWRVYEHALERGAYLRPLGDTVYVAPALNILDDDLDALLAILEESIVAATPP